MEYTIGANIIDIINRKIYSGEILVNESRIKKITPTGNIYKIFVIPGLIDAHIHIESSMLVPSEFSRLAVKHGTVATVSDPHEIANVLGIEGIKLMHLNGEKYLLNSILVSHPVSRQLNLKLPVIKLIWKKSKNYLSIISLNISRK